MDIDALTDDDRKQLAKDLAAELDTGRYGNRFVLSKRQLLSIAGGSAGVAGLTALGVDPATAQSAAGQVGTESSPEDIYAFNLDVQGALQRDLDAGGQAISNVESLSTESTTTEQSYNVSQTAPEGSGKAVFRIAASPRLNTKVENTIHYEQVGTTETKIVDDTDINFPRSGLVLVCGMRQDDETIHFTDLVLVANVGQATVLGSASRGSPDNRSYSQNRLLEMSMDANTYDVGARMIGLEL